MFACTYVSAPKGDAWPQPFALLGGMPTAMQYLSLRLPLCRVKLGYTIGQLQNAHVITVACDGDDPSDVVRQCLRYAIANTDESTEMERLFPAFTDTRRLIEATAVKTKWLPKNGSGRYGSRDFNFLTTLWDKLLSASAYEQLYSEQLRAGKEGPLSSNVYGYCLAEAGRLSGQWYLVDNGDAKAILDWLGAYPDRLVQLMQEDIKRAAAAWGWALTERVKAIEAGRDSLCSRIQLHKEEYARLLMGDAVPKEGTPFLHITAVVGHHDRKGAGQAALTTLCAQADEAGVALLLDSLPQDGLPLYYTRYGFRAVKCSAAALSSASLRSSDLLYMWRPPQPTGGVGAGTEEPPVLSEQAASLRALVLSSPVLEAYPPVRQNVSKLYDAHLTKATEAFIYAHAVSTHAGLYLDFSTWAKEFVLQVRSGESSPGSLVVPTREEQDRAEYEEAARVANSVACANAAHEAARKRRAEGNHSRRSAPGAPSRTSPSSSAEDGEEDDGVVMLEEESLVTAGATAPPPPSQFSRLHVEVAASSSSSSNVPVTVTTSSRAGVSRFTGSSTSGRRQRPTGGAPPGVSQSIQLPGGAGQGPITLQFYDCNVTIHVVTTTTQAAGAR